MLRQRTTRVIITGAAVAVSALLWLSAGRGAQAEDGDVLRPPPIPFTWQLSATDAAHLYESVKALRYGDSLVSVKAMLGAPTLEQDFADKQGGHRARQFLYAIRRVRPQGGNAYDQEISLVFGDQSHRLLEIWYTNLAPLGGDIIWTIKDPGTTAVISTFTRPPMR